MKMGAIIYWIATMVDVNTAEVLYSARERLSDLGEAYDKLPRFAEQLTAKIPMHNIFVGKWRSSDLGGKGLTCILDFKADGTIIVERYDVSSVGIDKLRLTGSGSYSFDRSSLTISLTLKPPNNRWDSGDGTNDLSMARDFGSLRTSAGYSFDNSGNAFLYKAGDWNNTLWCLKSNIFGNSMYINFVKTQ
jgi:hypothetical protein